MRGILLAGILLSPWGGIGAGDVSPGDRLPPWFVLEIRTETVMKLFLEAVQDPRNLPRDCNYGGRAHVLGRYALRGRTYARVEYRLLCLEISPDPHPFPRRRLQGTERDFRIVPVTDIFRPRTLQETFEFRWTGKAWRMEQ